MFDEKGADGGIVVQAFNGIKLNIFRQSFFLVFDTLVTTFSHQMININLFTIHKLLILN